MAGRPAVLEPEAGSANGLGSSSEPVANGEAKLIPALRLAGEARVLPSEVRWIYLRALRSAVRADGASSLCDIEHPAELARLIELGNRSQRVIGFGSRCWLTAISLALGEDGRHVTIFDPLAESWRSAQHLRHLDPAVRSRIDFLSELDQTILRELPVCDLVFVDRSIGDEEGLVAARCGARIVRPGGLLILRGYPRRVADELLDELRLDVSFFDGDFVWRKPANWGRRGSRTASKSLPTFALRGLLAGMAAAVLLPASLSETLPGTTGNEKVDSASRATVSGTASNRGATRVRPPGKTSSRRTSSTPTSRRPSARPAIVAPPGRTRPERPRAPAGGAGADTGGISGAGTRQLGTLRVDRPMRLRWSTEGRSFVIVSDAWRFRPRRRRGTTLLSPGTYRRFTVKATAGWKLRLRPAAQ